MRKAPPCDRRRVDARNRRKIRLLLAIAGVTRIGQVQSPQPPERLVGGWCNGGESRTIVRLIRARGDATWKWQGNSLPVLSPLRRRGPGAFNRDRYKVRTASVGFFWS